MRHQLTRDRLRRLMEELARSAPRRGSFRVFLVGGGTAVQLGWRESSIDADLYSDEEDVFREIQEIKERLNMNVEFARPEDFVPSLEGTEGRHLFIDTIGPISFYHYDPYAQVFSKVVRGFQRDLEDAREFVRAELVNPRKLQSLVREIPAAAFSRYPRLTKAAVEKAVDGFVAEFSSSKK